MAETILTTMPEEERRGDERGRRSNDVQVRRGHAEQTPVSVISMWFIGPSAEKNP
jgi:hypothetical protein